MSADWSDEKKWWMALLRNALLVAVLALVLAPWLGHRSRERDERHVAAQLQWAMQLSQRSQALQRFNAESARYAQATEQAFLVACNGSATLPTHARQDRRPADPDDRLTAHGQALLAQWQGERSSSLEAALSDLQSWHPDNSAIADKAEELRAVLRDIRQSFHDYRDRKRGPRPCDWEADWLNGERAELRARHELLSRELGGLVAKAGMAGGRAY